MPVSKEQMREALITALFPRNDAGVVQVNTAYLKEANKFYMYEDSKAEEVTQPDPTDGEDYED